MADVFNEMARNRFSSSEEVRKYRGEVGRGLLTWEQTIVYRYFQVQGRILDIGCGGGREAIALHRLGYSVTGIDISASEVESSRASAAEMDLDIDFQVCAGDSLNFANAYFDYVTIWAQALGNVASHASRVRLLRECARVVEPTGGLAFSVHNRDACEPVIYAKNMIETVDGVVLEDGDFVLNGDSESDTPCYWHYFDREEISRLCADSGWTILECDLAKEFGQADWQTVWVCVAEKGEASNDS